MNVFSLHACLKKIYNFPFKIWILPPVRVCILTVHHSYGFLTIFSDFPVIFARM